MATLSFGTDNTATVTVRNSSGALDDGATVTLTIVDTSENQLTGMSWPLSLTSVGGGSGQYTGTVTAATLNIVRTQTTVSIVSASKGGTPAVSRIDTYVSGDDD